MQILDVMYLVLWGGLALYCVLSARRISPILYILGGFFVFMFAWYLVNDLIDVNLFAGIYNWIFRGICVVFLAVIVIIYVIIKKNSKE